MIHLRGKSELATDEPFVFIKLNEENGKEPADVAEQIEEFKASGNEFFRLKIYERAIDEYSKAIYCFETPARDRIELAKCYQNRAAAHQQVGNWPKCIEDSTKAIEANDVYAKAYYRRARGYFCQQKNYLAMQDAMQACILARFRVTEFNRLAMVISNIFGKYY